jgi:hypothetical protein
MEIGASAVLVNTAISVAADPVAMAKAFAKATEAGREAYLAGWELSLLISQRQPVRLLLLFLTINHYLNDKNHCQQ